MNTAIAVWLRNAAEGASFRLGRGGGSDAALAVARAAGFAGYLARAGRLRRPKPESLKHRLDDVLLLEAAQDLSAALDAGGVRHCFVKGAALLGRVYEPGDRDLLDLDLVLHPLDVRPAIAIVEGLGYARAAGGRQSAAAGMQRGLDFERAAPHEGFGEVRLDVQWAVAPVNRLLSYADTVPLAGLWSLLDRDGPVPAPGTPHHLALLIHHLAHHDLLHARCLLDAALLWERLDAGGRAELDGTARSLGVQRLARALGGLFHRQLGFPPLAPRPPRGWRGRALRAVLRPTRWLAWAVGSDERTHLEITPARIGRRLLVIDRLADVRHLVRDLVFPPRTYLRWRWPEARTVLEAWWIHVGRVVGKAAARDLPA